MALPTSISQYPGILWLIFGLPKIIAPAFVVYAIISCSLGLLVGWESLDGSRWKVALASALTFPTLFFCSITWVRLRVTHRARSLGATSPPVIAGRLPGSLDIVWPIAKSRFTAYPGERTSLVLLVTCQTAVAPLTLPHRPTLTLSYIGDRVDEWLRERNQTMIFRIFFEDRVSGKPPPGCLSRFGSRHRTNGFLPDGRSSPQNRHTSRFVSSPLRRGGYTCLNFRKFDYLVRLDSRSWQPTLTSSGKVCSRPPLFAEVRLRQFCRGEVPWTYGPPSWSWDLQHGRRPVEVSPFDVAPVLRKGENSTLSDIRPTCKRCGRSDQKSVKGGHSHRHPGSSVVLCGTGQELTAGGA